MKTRLKQLWQERRGQTLVEFALVLPLLMFIVLGVIEFGRLFYGYSTLQNAARHAADVASKAPPGPDLGDPVPDDPLGRVRAIADDPSCETPGYPDCYMANIRTAARRYATVFSPQDPNIQVYFLPVEGVASNEVGYIVEVVIEYKIMPITPVLKDWASLGIPVTVDSRRTIITSELPSAKQLTGLPNTPPPTVFTSTPLPGCGGKYTWQDEHRDGAQYIFQITNVSAGNGHGIVGLLIGWCQPDLGSLLSVTIGGVSLPGGPWGSGGISLPGGGITLNQGDTVTVVMTFEHSLTGNAHGWPTWNITFDDYCALWSPEGRDCPFPTGTPLPSLTPTNTPSPTGSPLPSPTGTTPPVCGMYIQAGPVFAGDTVSVLLYNSGNTSPDLSQIVVMWGDGLHPLTSVHWQGGTVWTGTKYYSAFLRDLTGNFPAGSLAQLEFVFQDGPINWLSFQASFNNNCSVSYSDPTQPTPPPIPTIPTSTPTPTPDPCAPFQYVGETGGIQPNRKQVRLQIINYGTTPVYINRIVVSNWRSVQWGQLTTINVLGTTYTLNDNSPPAELTVTGVQLPGDSQPKSIYFNFANNIQNFDPSQISGYVELANGCLIDY